MWIDEVNRLTKTAAYAIERGVTRPSMPRMLATFFFVAFFWESEALRGFFLVAPFSSTSTKDSEDEGDIKMLENVCASLLAREQRVN